jgi:hypothetical protein
MKIIKKERKRETSKSEKQGGDGRGTQGKGFEGQLSVATATRESRGSQRLGLE